MGRLFFLVLINLGAFFVLRQLWPSVRAGWRRGAFIALAVLSALAMAVPRLLDHGGFRLVSWLDVPLRLFGAAWSIASLIVLFFGWPLALVRSRRERARAKVSGAPPAEDVNLRRRGLLAGAGRALPFVAVGTSTVGLVEGASGFVLRELEVRLRGLPRELDGFRIGQITDVHVGTFIDTTYVRAAVAAMNAARVDLQVMTGDLIDDLSQLDGTMAALETCQAPHGMVAILGNHEHWRGLDEVIAAYARSEDRGGNVRLLVDDSLVFEHAGQPVRVVGVDYPMRGRNMRVQEDLMHRSAERAFTKVSPGETVLCLTHHPAFFSLALERGARLTLAGHTHGGQVAFFGIPIFWFAFEYMLGRYRKGGGQLYVSGGTGHWLPFRIGVPAEVTILTLRAEG